MAPRLIPFFILILVGCTEAPQPGSQASQSSAKPSRALVSGPSWERTTAVESEKLAATGLVIDREKGELRVPGEVNTMGFQLPLLQPGYHFLCYDEGRISPLALITTPVSDLAIQSALESLGAVPGENLEQACWDERSDPKSPAATRKVQGSAVEAFVIIEGERVPLSELIKSPGGRGLDLRLGGNLRLRPQWKSGCVVCLVSCPGGRLSNAAYSCHEYGTGAGQFELRDGAEDRLDKAEKVTVVLALKKKKGS